MSSQDTDDTQLQQALAASLVTHEEEEKDWKQLKEAIEASKRTALVSGKAKAKTDAKTDAKLDYKSQIELVNKNSAFHANLVNGGVEVTTDFPGAYQVGYMYHTYHIENIEVKDPHSYIKYGDGSYVVDNTYIWDEGRNALDDLKNGRFEYGNSNKCFIIAIFNQNIHFWYEQGIKSPLQLLRRVQANSDLCPPRNVMYDSPHVFGFAAEYKIDIAVYPTDPSIMYGVDDVYHCCALSPNDPAIKAVLNVWYNGSHYFTGTELVNLSLQSPV